MEESEYEGSYRRKIRFRGCIFKFSFIGRASDNFIRFDINRYSFTLVFLWTIARGRTQEAALCFYYILQIRFCTAGAQFPRELASLKDLSRNTVYSQCQLYKFSNTLFLAFRFLCCDL
jgi:hypothetical protein